MAKKRFVLAGMICGLSLAGCSVFGLRDDTQQPHYSVIARIGDVEIRQYGERLAAETTVPGQSMEATRNAAFRILADYIFGKNKAKMEIAMTAPVSQSSERIAMTAPVSQQQTRDGWKMRFFLPEGMALDSAPVPNDPRVKIVVVPREDYAVLRFSGSRDDGAVKSHIAKLRAALSGRGWQPIGNAVAWFYDPPWTLPFLRRNEVAIEVGSRSKLP